MKKLRALFVEDSEVDVELVLYELRRGGYECDWLRVDGPEAFRAAIREREWDVILSDFNMPGFSAPAALEILKATGVDIPFIIVSGSVAETTAVDSMKSGAHDFFAKSNLTRLVAAVEREVREARVRQERERAVVQLRGVEERYRLLVEHVRDHAIFMLDPDAKVTTWNYGAERVTGWKEDEILGKPMSTFFEEEDRRRGKPEQALESAARNGSYQTEGTRVRKDGTKFWSTSTIDCIRVGGALVGYTCIIRDISEKKRLLDDLEAAVAARDEFLSIASHELKTPLTPIALQLASLARLKQVHPDISVSDPKVASKLASIERSIERLTVLVNNLLDVTRITSGRLDIRPEPVELGELVRNVVARMRESIDRSGCDVRISIAPGLSGVWDSLRLDTVVANLLSNAIKYGSGRPIEIEGEQDAAGVVLRVRDHGIGISPEQHARIFDRFERAVSDRNYGGFGLGLWIVRQIVEAHGGVVRVESKEGEGSTFTVHLPREPKRARDCV